MTGDEFLRWCLDQEDTWELIDGVPALKFDNGPEMMAGSRRHARIASNLIAALASRLAGGPATPSAATSPCGWRAGTSVVPT